MRVVYWARLQLAKRQIVDALQAVPGAELSVVETLADLLAALKGAQALILYDAPPDEARPVVDALSAPGNSVRWMHFLTAGREGFEAVGLPAECRRHLSGRMRVADRCGACHDAVAGAHPARSRDAGGAGQAQLVASRRVGEGDLGRRQGHGDRRLRPDRPRDRAARQTLRHQDHRGLAHAQVRTNSWMKAARCPSSIRRSRAPTS